MKSQHICKQDFLLAWQHQIQLWLFAIKLMIFDVKPNQITLPDALMLLETLKKVFVKLSD